jgi:hypothetical protein
VLEWLLSKIKEITNDDNRKKATFAHHQGNVNWYNHCGKPCGSFSKIKTRATF